MTASLSSPFALVGETALTQPAHQKSLPPGPPHASVEAIVVPAVKAEPVKAVTKPAIKAPVVITTVQALPKEPIVVAALPDVPAMGN